MNWLARLLRRGRQPGSEHRRALDAYRDLPKPDLRGTLQATRWVIADVESSGLSPYRDRLISIGAVAICDGVIRFDQSFEAVLRQDAPSEHGNILVHGIGGTIQVSGLDPAEALTGFLGFAGKAPLIGFHSDFDRVMIARAARDVLGFDPVNVWLDLAVLAPALFGGRAPSAHTLDDWLKVFGIDNYARHDAVADALATAQLFQIVAAQAVQQGLTSCADLIRFEKGRRWLGTG